MSLLLRRYTSTYRRHPYSASFVTCCLKGALADIVAQTAQLEGSSRDPPAEGSSQQVAAAAGPAEYSPRRTALFALWSGAYCGSAQHYIFNVLFSRVFGAGTSVGVALSKACADSFVATPLLGIPIYYACKPLIEGGGGSPLDGLQEYGSIFREFYFKPAMVWIPAHLVTFSVCPPPLRIGWTACVSLGWLSFVSITSHREAPDRAHHTSTQNDAAADKI